MTTAAMKQKLKAVRDFGAATLFTGAAIFYYHATMPEDPRAAQNPAATHAFVDANPIRLHWMTAAFKQPAPEQTASPKAATIKSAETAQRPFVDGKPIRLGQ